MKKVLMMAIAISTIVSLQAQLQQPVESIIEGERMPLRRDRPVEPTPATEKKEVTGFGEPSNSMDWEGTRVEFINLLNRATGSPK